MCSALFVLTPLAVKNVSAACVGSGKYAQIRERDPNRFSATMRTLLCFDYLWKIVGLEHHASIALSHVQLCIHWSWQFCLVSTVMSHYAKAVTDHSSRMTFNILSILRLCLLNFNFTINTDSHNIIMSVRNDVWVKSMMALTDEMKTSQTFQHKSAIQPTKHYLGETKIRVQRELKRKWAKQDGDLEMMKKTLTSRTNRFKCNQDLGGKSKIFWEWICISWDKILKQFCARDSLMAVFPCLSV